jgi:DNA-directed RNA polymerase subunit RPC12/RpoP
LNLLHKSHECDQCGAKFDAYDDLIKHAREVHHHPIVKCRECGKEFIHEKDRLHHVREEHEKKMRQREEKNLDKHHEHGHSKKDLPPQEEVDIHTRKFSNNFE